MMEVVTQPQSDAVDLISRAVIRKWQHQSARRLRWLRESQKGMIRNGSSSKIGALLTNGPNIPRSTEHVPGDLCAKFSSAKARYNGKMRLG